MSKSFSISSLAGFIIALTLILPACKEKEIYPPNPSIEWGSYYFLIEQNAFGQYDTLIGVRFTYKDGDGDIGLNQGDTLPPFDRQADSLGVIHNPYYYNLNVEYLEMKNGVIGPFILPNTTDTFKVQARISSLTPDGVHKAIRGTVDYQFQAPLYPDLRSDSVLLRIRLTDRALHESNVIESPWIILP